MGIAAHFQSLVVCWLIGSFRAVSRFMPKSAKPSRVPSYVHSIPEVEKVSSSVIRILGMNPSFHTLQGTNTYLVGMGSSRLLIDSGEGEPTASKFATCLREVMEEEGVEEIESILISHGHYDHQGGVPTILQMLKDHFPGSKEPAIFKALPVEDPFPPRHFEALPLEADATFEPSGGGVSVEVMFTPGHTADHCSFLIREGQDERTSILCTGDCILGCGSTVFEKLSSYMASLHTLREVVQEQDVQILCPGHGPVIRGREEVEGKVNEYIEHRLLREEQVLAVLQKHREASRTGGLLASLLPLSSYVSTWSITHSMYKNRNLNFLEKLSARGNVLHHLEKLKEEGEVEGLWGDIWRVKGTYS